MRKILIALLLLPFISKGQDTTGLYSYLLLKDAQITFERVYDIPNTNKSELYNKLKSFIPSVPYLSQFNATANGQFSGRLVKAMIPIQKYGGHAVGGYAPVKCPIDANVTILIKDNKYKIIISGILFEMSYLSKDFPDMTIEDLITKKKKTMFKTGEYIESGMVILQKYFTDEFTLKSTSDNW